MIHTRGYLKVWLNDYLIFNFTADLNPWISSIWGQYVSWQQVRTFGSGWLLALAMVRWRFKDSVSDRENRNGSRSESGNDGG